MHNDFPRAVVAAFVANVLAVIAVLPDLSEPGVIALGATLGGFLAALYAQLRGRPREAVRDAAFDGAFIGTGWAIVVYLIANIAGV